MFYCDSGLFDSYETISKEVALKETIKYIGKNINKFHSCSSAAIEFVEFYKNILGKVTYFAEKEIREIAKYGANVCLTARKYNKVDMDKRINLYLDTYNLIYFKVKEEYKDILLESKSVCNKGVQRVKVRKVKK